MIALGPQGWKKECCHCPLVALDVNAAFLPDPHTLDPLDVLNDTTTSLCACPSMEEGKLMMFLPVLYCKLPTSADSGYVQIPEGNGLKLALPSSSFDPSKGIGPHI